jgi:phosphatidylglycerol:prolipoprotein diacylglycerol transferase
MLPHLIRIGGFSLPTYGALVAIAFLVALWMTSRFAKQRGMNSEKVVNLGVYCALIGMLGAKLLMIVMDPIYRQHPAEIFTRETLQSAGIFYGGFIAALLFAFLYMQAQKMPVLSTADLFAPGVALGHGIGRLGCFSAGCCWGKPTSLPWAVTFTSKDTTTGVPLGIPLHPTQLYEAFAEGIICLILIWQLRRGHRTGQVIGMYLLLYGMVRFVVEFLRQHDEANPFGGPFVLEQWISLAVAVGGAWLLTRRNAKLVTAPA